jgi:hypothetical protein
MRKMLLVAAGFAATLAQGPARALVFTPTTFDGNKAVIDETSGLGWVTPNIAAGDTWDTIDALCHGSVCTGALAGLHWASATQVSHFWADIGIPLNGFGSYSAIGDVGQLLPSLIGALGPTHSSTTFLIGTTNYLAGITNNPETLGIPNTSYLFHFSSVLGAPLDNESAFTTGAGNGFAELPATKGWFYFTPTAIPESSTWAMMIIGFASLGFAAYRGTRNRLDAALA